MRKDEIIKMIVEHPCPSCGRKIKDHSESNITYYIRDNKMAVCEHLRANLVLDKLLYWYMDAVDERDAYIKSYEDLVDEMKQRSIEKDLND